MGKRDVELYDGLAARVAAERAWCWARYVEGYPYPTIRAMANEPTDVGGLGYDLSVSAIRAMVAEHRAAQGSIIGTREERIERRQLRLDQIALDAQRSMARAREVGVVDKDAAKLLLDTMAHEGKMHGDDAALRIEADVTTRDAVTEELAAAVAALGLDPIPVE